MITDSAVNRDLTVQLVIEIIPLKVYKLVKSYKLYFYMIKWVINWFKIKISDNCFNFIGG